MKRDYYGSLGVYDIKIIKNDKEFEFNYTNKINIIQSCDGDFLIMDLEVVDDEVDEALKDGNCTVIAKSRAKYGETGINFTKEYKFNEIKLVNKTSLNLEEGGINRYIYILSNGTYGSKIINKMVQDYLLNEKINEFILATNKASKLIADSLMDINSKVLAHNEERKLGNEKIYIDVGRDCTHVLYNGERMSIKTNDTDIIVGRIKSILNYNKELPIYINTRAMGMVTYDSLRNEGYNVQMIDNSIFKIN